jgi:hypothetical protein
MVVEGQRPCRVAARPSRPSPAASTTWRQEQQQLGRAIFPDFFSLFWQDNDPSKKMFSPLTQNTSTETAFLFRRVCGGRVACPENIWPNPAQKDKIK